MIELRLISTIIIYTLLNYIPIHVHYTYSIIYYENSIEFCLCTSQFWEGSILDNSETGEKCSYLLEEIIAPGEPVQLYLRQVICQCPL